MKNHFMKILVFISCLLLTACVSAQEHNLIKEAFISTPEQQQVNIHTIQYQVTEYIQRVKNLVAHARRELKANKNSRPSTEYSIYDIVFTFTDYLPSWVYPESIWKQDLITRRRNIAKILRSSPLTIRPRTIIIRDKVAEWTKRSVNTLNEEYVTSTANDLESLLYSTNDFIATATDIELMDPLFLSAGYLALDNAIQDFINGNNEKFNNIINEINQDFNNIVTLSGELRIPLESLRNDVIKQSKYIRNEMFDKSIEHRIKHFGYHITNELQNLLQVKVAEEENQIEASKALRKHTADSLHTEIQSLNDIKMTLGRSKSIINHLWENATNELVQSPSKLDYWIDVAAEVKEAVIELGRIITTKKKQYNKKLNNYHCACGWNN